MQSEYEEARAEAEKRRRIRSADVRARYVLRIVGWTATEFEIATWLETIKQHYDGEHQLIVDTALRLQRQDTKRGRRLSDEEMAEVAKRYGVPEEKRTAVRERVAKLIAEKPDLPREAARITINREFGLEIQPENFRVSYWIPAGGKLQPRAARTKSANTTPAADARRPAAKKVAGKKKPRTSRLLFRLIELEELPGDRAALRIAVGGYEFTLAGVRT